ncbi:MAG: cell wall hydrolase [Marinosulfonomonas sp.]
MKQLWLAIGLCMTGALATAGSVSADTRMDQTQSPAVLAERGTSANLSFDVASISPDQLNGYGEFETSRRLALKPTDKIAFTRDFLNTLPTTQGDKEWRCLAEALYFEARGESVRGQFAVAEVILNRVDSNRFPDTICKVIHQGTGRKFACQFTYTCDGHKETILEPKAWDRVGKVATLMLNGAPRILTHGATHYHTKNVNPRWARVFPLTATIGMHRFYRQPTRTASAS